MRPLILAFAAAAVTLLGFAAVPAAAGHPETEEARFAAVLLRADWCSSCKIMEPKLDAVKAEEPIRDLVHVTLDYTARDKAAFYEAARGHRVGEALDAQLDGGVITGIVLLVDRKEGRVVADLRKELSPKALRAAMIAAVAEGADV